MYDSPFPDSSICTICAVSNSGGGVPNSGGGDSNLGAAGVRFNFISLTRIIFWGRFLPNLSHFWFRSCQSCNGSNASKTLQKLFREIQNSSNTYIVLIHDCSIQADKDVQLREQFTWVPKAWAGNDPELTFLCLVIKSSWRFGVFRYFQQRLSAPLNLLIAGHVISTFKLRRCSRSCWWIREPLSYQSMNMWRNRLVHLDSDDSWVVLSTYSQCIVDLLAELRIFFALFAIHRNSWASL